MKGKINLFQRKKPFYGFLVISLGFFTASCQSSNSPVVAQVDSEKITAEDLQKELFLRSPDQENLLLSKEIRRELLDILVRRKLILSEAKREGIHKTEAFKKKLKNLRRRLRNQMNLEEEMLLAAEYYQILQDNVLNVTEEEAQNFYKTESEFKIRHILVRSQEEAEEIVNKLSKGQSFERLAKLHSLDASSSQSGGDLGYVTRGTLVRELENAAYALQKGETSAIISTRFGYHLIQKIDQRPLSHKDLEPKLLESIGITLQSQKFGAWLERARAKHPVTIQEDVLAKMSINPNNADLPVQSKN